MKNGIIIMGCAPCLQEDLDAIENHELFDFMAIGIDTIEKTNIPISYIATYHTEDLRGIKEKMGHKKEYKIISFEQKEGVDIVVPFLFGAEHHKTTGSSSLLGVCYAIQEGYKKIILAGCPMEGKNSQGHSYEQFYKGWKFHKDKIIGKTKSMSGWTKEFLGESTKEWLEE